jgi:hypothetical protein
MAASRPRLATEVGALIWDRPEVCLELEPAWERRGGPYAKTQEVLTGHWIVECHGFDRATEIAGGLADCPAPEQVRPTPTPTCDRSWNPPPKSPTEQESVFGTEVESLLRRLAQLSYTPIIALNQVVAVAMVDGAAAGLQRLETLANDKQLADDHRLYAVRAHLLEMTGDAGAPLDAYRAAARRASNLPQPRYLNRRAARGWMRLIVPDLVRYRLSVTTSS